MICLAIPLILALVGDGPGAQTPKDALERLLQASWDDDLRESPLFASRVGDPRYNDRLPDDSLEGHTRGAQILRRQLDQLQAIDRARLNRPDQVTYDVFARLKRDALAEYDFHVFETPLTNREGFHIDFARLPQETTFRSEKDYADYIQRLRAFRTWVDQQVASMRHGMQDGHVLPRVAMEGVQESIRAHIREDPAQTVFFEPCQFVSLPIDAAKKAAITESCRAAIRTFVVPGYQAFLDFIVKEYLPACRATIGASALPSGKEFYAHRVRQFTTLDTTPEQVHETGIHEVERIHREMEAAIHLTGFTGSFAEFLALLRTDPRFYSTTPEELLKTCSWVCKRMDGELPRLFRTLPRLPYGIRPIPDFIAEKTTGAYYSPGSGDGTRAGTYFVNTSNLKSRPLYVVEALSFHESVPGHHLQLAVQQEIQDLPPFRRFVPFDAFIEGWALYAEHLGLEVGFYKDPYSNFGRLTYEMWRACRLVVDTGIHALGWSREKAIDFMAANTALSLHEVTTEVDRYIAWPGQALAYKIGELKIRELRKKAEDALGTGFDVREFHEAVLKNGAVPLDVLESSVNAFVDSHKTAPSTRP
jgi:uncharacterized protein (DUF885 family)